MIFQHKIDFSEIYKSTPSVRLIVDLMAAFLSYRGIGSESFCCPSQFFAGNYNISKHHYILKNNVKKHSDDTI